MTNPVRVAVYARVSTDGEDQINSLESQKGYFKEYVERQENWELYKIYPDEGISGTSTKKRAKFNAMIKDAYDGKFDLIITKEVSRFARNTLDTLDYTRKLKRHNVHVLFINDGINTRDSDSELRLSIMATIAQEESRKTSDRVKWGQKRQMEKGIVFGRHMLGYNVINGKLQLEEAGAEIVRMIFHKFVNEGKGTHVIARELREVGIKPLNPDRNARYKNNWSNTVILRVLRNEKYVGDLEQKKTFTPDYLTHEKKYNRGHEEKVYIKDHHSEIAIIDRELWEAAQAELARRSPSDEQKAKHSNRYWTSGKVFCGECGDNFINCIKTRKDGSRYISLRCFIANQQGHKKLVNGEEIGCTSAFVNERVLFGAMEFILSHIIQNKKAIISDMKHEILSILNDNKPIVRDKSRLENKLAALENKKTRAIDLRLSGEIDAAELKRQKEKYTQEIMSIKEQIRDLENYNDIKNTHILCIEDYMRKVEKIMQFDSQDANEALYDEVLERVTAYNGKVLDVKLKCLPMAIRLKYRTSGKMENYCVHFDSLEML